MKLRITVIGSVTLTVAILLALLDYWVGIFSGYSGQEYRGLLRYTLLLLGLEGAGIAIYGMLSGGDGDEKESGIEGGGEIEKLERLGKLRDEKVITRREFEKKKEEILERVWEQENPREYNSYLLGNRGSSFDYLFFLLSLAQ